MQSLAECFVFLLKAYMGTEITRILACPGRFYLHPHPFLCSFPVPTHPRKNLFSHFCSSQLTEYGLVYVNLAANQLSDNKIQSMSVKLEHLIFVDEGVL